MKNLASVLELDPQEGDVGVEIEVEAKLQLPRDTKPDWRAVKEGSLRNIGMEYITPGAVDLSSLTKRTKNLNDKLEGCQVIEDCPRTSVHVHVNMQKATVPQTLTTMTAFWLLENPLTEYCGPDRVGNVFCQRLKDTEAIIDIVKDDVLTDSKFLTINSNECKYANQNLANLSVLGTLEYRGMRGTTDPKIIQDWADCLVKIRDEACQYKNPADFLDDYFVADRELFVKNMLTKNMYDYVSTRKDYMKTINENVGTLCHLAYCVDWDKPLKKKKRNKFYEADPHLLQGLARGPEAVAEPIPEEVEVNW